MQWTYPFSHGSNYHQEVHSCRGCFVKEQDERDRRQLEKYPGDEHVAEAVAKRWAVSQ